jgi:hypothetical protein
MKQDEMIVIGLAGLALLLVFKATAKKPLTSSAALGAEPFRMKGDGSTGNWLNDFGYQRDKEYMALIGL